MGWRLTSDQAEMRDALRRALEARAPLGRMRQAFEAGQGDDEDVWRAIADLGCLSLLVPEACGGAGLGWAEAAVAAHELGRVLAPASFASAATALRLLATAGDAAAQARWLGSAVAGGARGCLAILEGEDPFAAPAARFGGGRLSGRKLAVAGARTAAFAVVSCAAADGEAGFALLDLAGPGVRRGEASPLDPTRGHAVLEFEEAPAVRLTGAAEDAGLIIDAYAVLLAAAQVGGAERCLEMAVEYAKTRRAFGRAIGSFQSIKQKLVTGLAQLDLARAHVGEAVRTLDAQTPDRALAAAGARVSASQAFDYAAKEALQTHGALGIAWAHDAHLFLRRARMLAVEAGATAQWKSRLVDDLRDAPAEAGDEGQDDTPEEARYRREARAWLSAQGFARGSGRRKQEDFSVPAVMSAGRAWQAAKAQAGYAAIHWPRAFGGGGGGLLQREIFAQEERRFDTPALNVFDIGLGMCGPTVLRFASEAQKQRLIPPLVRGEEIWCQLFSEPAAGSDLAGVRTRASRDGDDWRIRGQKVWTSYAQFADWGLLLARSDPNKPKHQGLTMFFVNMRSPGVEVRPLRQLAGVAEFNEVFFDDVFVPDAQRLGEADEGWRTAVHTLMHERSLGLSGVDFESLLAVAREASIRGRPATEDGAVRDRLAEAWIAGRGLELNYRHAISLLSSGGDPGPEFSVGKLVAAAKNQETAAFLLDLLGPSAIEATHAAQQHEWLMTARNRLAGGSDEIMATILAERVLGLPQEPRVDKGVPFHEVV